MKTLSLLAAIAVCSAPVSAQALNEPFDTSVTGNFPPANWTVSLTAAHVLGTDEWSEVSVVLMNSGVGASFPQADAAAHQYYLGTVTGTSADRLETPDMDLSSYGAPQLTYDGCLGWSAYMAHTAGAGQIGASYIEVSTDGGTTWSQVWQEAATADYYTVGITEDLTAFAANNPQVRIGFLYEGDYAHEWGIDNVIVDNVGPTGPSLAISGSCPGPLVADAANLTPGSPVVFAYGVPGSFTAGGGACAGITVPIAAPTILSTVIADAAGNASIAGSPGPAACGAIVLVAVDVATCSATNGVGV